NIYRTPDLSDRRYGRGGRIEEADGTRYKHDDDGNLIEKTDVLGDTTRRGSAAAAQACVGPAPQAGHLSFEHPTLLFMPSDLPPPRAAAPAQPPSLAVAAREGCSARTSRPALCLAAAGGCSSSKSSPSPMPSRA
ncbi:MAG TPA: hypothetical protein VIL20_18515, partial [Sandaracinaceae bacterium]